jgi:WD40 repeat protein
MDLLETEEDQSNLPPCSADTFFENTKSSEKKISHKYTLGDITSPTFCLRFDHNDKYIAAGRGDGSIQIFNLFTGKQSYLLNQDMEEVRPCTGLK